MLTLLLLALPPVLAGPAELQACCTGSGASSCGGFLRVYGDDTRLSRDPGGWSLEGAWNIACDGKASFQSSDLVYLDHAPQIGEVAMPEADPREVSCFVSSCLLPRGLCVSEADLEGVRYVRTCATGRPPERGALLLPPAETETARVVIGGKLIYAEQVTSGASPAAGAGAADAGGGATAAPPKDPTPTNPQARTELGEIAVADPIAALVAGLPPDPTSSCKSASDSARVESRQLVLYADDLRLAGDHAGALARFRAALTVDRCNAYGWLGLGQTSAALARPDLAIRGLRNAVLLMPRHYGAWTELGKAYETINQREQALICFRRALSLNAEYPEALAGVRRLGGSVGTP